MIAQRRAGGIGGGRGGVLLAVAGVLLLPASARGEESSESRDYWLVPQLNSGLPRLKVSPDLDTPQSALANFEDAAARGDYLRAAFSLNLNAIPPARQPIDGPRLAEHLKTVMDQQVWFHWDDVPDRPDGIDDEERSLDDKPDPAPNPRSNIKLYSLKLGDRDYEFRLERVKAPGQPPAWVFSRQTVAHVPTLYAAFAPGRIEKSLPAFLRDRRVAKVALWQWIGFAVILGAGGLSGWLAQRGLSLALRRIDRPWSRLLAEAIRGPGAMAVGITIFDHLTRAYLGLAGPILSGLDPLFAAVIVVGLVWFLQRLIRLSTGLISRRYESLGGDESNVMLTRVAVASHLLTFLVVLGGALYVLTRFPWFRQLGTTLLASAGVAGVLLGIAGQRILGNLFAGVVLAVTQPVKAGDAVLFEGEFGWIEEIAFTYLVIRSWDLRRLVVPISHFMDRPIQNWSRRSQQLLRPVIVQADPRIDVEAARAEYAKILESAPDWDRSVPAILQVTDCKDGLLELRALCSASDPATSWSLQCFVRERLVAYLRDLDGGRFLPRRRVALVDEATPESQPAPHNGQAASVEA